MSVPKARELPVGARSHFDLVGSVGSVGSWTNPRSGGKKNFGASQPRTGHAPVFLAGILRGGVPRWRAVPGPWVAGEEGNRIGGLEGKYGDQPKTKARRAVDRCSTKIRAAAESVLVAALKRANGAHPPDPGTLGGLRGEGRRCGFYSVLAETWAKFTVSYSGSCLVL